MDLWLFNQLLVRRIITMGLDRFDLYQARTAGRQNHIFLLTLLTVKLH
jgi:hypothetical protein